MQKTNFTCQASPRSRRLPGTGSAKQIVPGTPKKMLKAFLEQSAKALVNPLGKAAAVAAMVATMHASAGAQTCNTFVNADAANPILRVVNKKAFISATNFADIDGDGDLDCYVSSNLYISPVLFRNKGTATHPVFQRSDTSGFSSDEFIYSLSNIQFVDIDGDGDYDCFASETYSGYGYVHIDFYENTGTPQQPEFVKNDAKNPVSNLRYYSYIPFQFADIDGDGDYDLYYYANGLFWNFPDYDVVVRNTGSKTNPVFNETISNTENTRKQDTRVYYDWNKDGRLDYFTSAYEEDAVYHQNIGRPRNPIYTDTIAGPVFENGAPYQIVDLNNDGVPEVFTITGRYSTLAPVAIIGDTTGVVNGTLMRRLYSINRSPGYKYRWERNGTTIAGASGYSVRVNQPGVYTLYVTSPCGTGVSLNYRVSDTTLTAQNRLGVSPNPVASGITVKAYPNPFVSEVTVQLPTTVTGSSNIRITDLAGRVLLSQSTSSSTCKAGSSLPKGSYLLQVWQQGALVYTTKLIKQ